MDAVLLLVSFDDVQIYRRNFFLLLDWGCKAQDLSVGSAGPYASSQGLTLKFAFWLSQ
jgi:hypothetical protein